VTPLNIARRVLPQPSQKTSSLSELERATELIYPEDFEEQVIAIVTSQGQALIFEITRLIFGKYLLPEMISDIRKRLDKMAKQGLVIQVGRGVFQPIEQAS